MGEILGLGITHYPSLGRPDERMSYTLKYALDDPGLPPGLRDPQAWPAAMRTEWGDDEGRAGAGRHRAALREGLARVRAELDEFDPDVVLIIGDDQYELFRETVVPPFCVLAWGDQDVRPHAHAEIANIWGEAPDWTIPIRGLPAAGKFLARRLLEQDFDSAYSYERGADQPFPHSIVNSVLYLDYERRGFPYPVVGLTINCYGRQLFPRKGFMSRLGAFDHEQLDDPPSPRPQRCLALGAALARTILDSPWRVALVASSSWSHSFLHEEGYHLHPAMDSDREYFAGLQSGDYSPWHATELADLERRGQQEMLNWFCLVGAMEAIDRPLRWAELTETWVFNSNKCFAVYEPTAARPVVPAGTPAGR
jgi:hypothetical protein